MATTQKVAKSVIVLVLFFYLQLYSSSPLALSYTHTNLHRTLSIRNARIIAPSRGDFARVIG